MRRNRGVSGDPSDTLQAAFGMQLPKCTWTLASASPHEEVHSEFSSIPRSSKRVYHLGSVGLEAVIVAAHMESIFYMPELRLAQGKDISPVTVVVTK